MKQQDFNDNKYTWNDLVKINEDAPSSFHPGEVGVICGMGKIEYQELADKYLSRIGSWMYTVEFSDGSDIVVTEEYLETYSENSPK